MGGGEVSPPPNVNDPASNFRALPFRNKGLNQNSVDILYAGNLGLHCTKIS